MLPSSTLGRNIYGFNLGETGLFPGYRHSMPLKIGDWRPRHCGDAATHDGLVRGAAPFSAACTCEVVKAWKHNRATLSIRRERANHRDYSSNYDDDIWRCSEYPVHKLPVMIDPCCRLHKKARTELAVDSIKGLFHVVAILHLLKSCEDDGLRLIGSPPERTMSTVVSIKRSLHLLALQCHLLCKPRGSQAYML